MVWTAITSQARTDFVFLGNCSLADHRYITAVLEDLITMGEDGIFMKDLT